MIQVHELAQKKMDDAKAFAESRGLSEQFKDKLGYLDNYACDENDEEKTLCIITNDHAPHGFNFVMKMRKTKDSEYAPWFNGGLLYYHAGDLGFGAPNFSVRPAGRDEGWEIHT